MQAPHHVSLLTLLVIATLVPSSQAQITDREVRQAIERGVAFLKSQQDTTRGGWLPEHEGQPGGLSALCTLALLSSGVPPMTRSSSGCWTICAASTNPR